MKTTTYFRRVGLVAVAAFGLAGTVQAMNTAAVNEVLKLKNAGVTEETIVAFIQGKNLDYALEADDILALQNKGLSSATLNAMLLSGKTPAPAPVTVPQPEAPQPATPATAASPVIVVPAAAPVVQPAAVTQPLANPDVAYFYQQLSPYGRWILTEDGRWCWQPSVAASTGGWRPYWDKGRWVWTDHGWYWASDYAWGWAAFHYGRWNLHPLHGWIWHPDRVWGPSWVVWRNSGDYCGWAPLPAGTVYDTVGGHFVFHNRRVEAGFDFGLGFTHFSFCFTKDMGKPMHHHLHHKPEVRAVFSRTVPHHHYTVNRVVVGGETRARVFNHGIEPSRLPQARKGRAPEPMRIQELRTPAPGRAAERMDTRNRTLEIYRPKFGGGGHR
ncbi:MAG: hypothetical protein JXQ71_15995 [Verrucomicrobia bacterium]|nr:hypothetical protein [Verrucomicrobiota bacterium]